MTTVSRVMQVPRRLLTPETLVMYEILAAIKARESFWTYRQYMNPGMKLGWWQRRVARELTHFYHDFAAGKAPIMLFQAPPQHGKSWTVIDFICWLSGRLPDTKTIYGSFSDRLGVRANLRVQRSLNSEKYQRAFPETQLAASALGPLGGYVRNQSVLEFMYRGSFRNTTVLGSVTGESLDLGVVDDPIKGRAEANSPAARDKVWDWFTDDFFSRFSETAGLIMMMTRWHVDDPAGRLIAHFGKERVKVVSFPAIATEDEQYRVKGEALFPEFKSKDFLLKRKVLMRQANWEAVYQQSPIIQGGGIFPIEKFSTVRNIDRKQIKRSVRYWDKAGTEGGTGAQTAGVLMHLMKDDTYVVDDVITGRWSALKRESIIKQRAELDRAAYGANVSVWVEQEPGSGGKESAENTVRQLAGFKARADKVTGSKETRADPYAAQVEGGNVKLREAEWNKEFIDQHELFPNGKLKDIVDAAAGAFAKLIVGGYDSSMSWVR